MNLRLEISNSIGFIFLELTVCVAPTLLAKSNLLSKISTAIIFDAPAGPILVVSYVIITILIFTIKRVRTLQ